MAGSFPVVAGGLALLCAVLMPLRLLSPDGTGRAVTVSMGLACAAGLGVLAMAGRRRTLPDRRAHPAVAAALLLAVTDACVHLVVTGNLRATTNVMLTVVGAGAGLVSRGWFATTAALAWAGWLAAATSAGISGDLAHYATALLTATALATALNVQRRRALRQLLDARDETATTAVRDVLTAVANRRGMHLLGAQIVEAARRQGDAAHCVFLDVDGLDHVNRELGHGAGDDVLVSVAEALRGSVRATDVVARWGGDQFCVVGPGPGKPPLQLEQRVRAHLRSAPPVDRQIWQPGIFSAGAVLAPWDPGGIEELLDRAEREMSLRRSLRRHADSSRRPAEAADTAE